MRVRLALALVLLLAAVPARSQSTDFAHPTPLGPGVNKGNIDSSVKGHFYSVTIGPGHVDADFAFKEMGLFGNPFRQYLNFDIYHEDGTLSAHNAVFSRGAIARLHVSGDLATRRRVILKISTQPGAIRLGGYYEIQMSGAAAFEGPTVGEGVTPYVSPSLINPMH